MLDNLCHGGDCLNESGQAARQPRPTEVRGIRGGCRGRRVLEGAAAVLAHSGRKSVSHASVYVSAIVGWVALRRRV